MGRFSGLSGIKTNVGSLYFLPGDYEVEITEVTFIKNRKKVDCYIIAATVLASNVPERAPGCEPSQVIAYKDGDQLEMALGNTKQFVATAMEIVDPDAYRGVADPAIPGDTVETATDRFWEEAIEMTLDDSKPCKGMRFHLNCVNAPTKAGNDFTRHVWSKSQLPAQVVA